MKRKVVIYMGNSDRKNNKDWVDTNNYAKYLFTVVDVNSFTDCMLDSVMNFGLHLFSAYCFRSLRLYEICFALTEMRNIISLPQVEHLPSFSIQYYQQKLDSPLF